MTTIDPDFIDTLLVQGLRERAAELGDEDRFYQQVLATISVLPQRGWFPIWPAGSVAGRVSCSSPRRW